MKLFCHLFVEKLAQWGLGGLVVSVLNLQAEGYGFKPQVGQ